MRVVPADWLYGGEELSKEEFPNIESMFGTFAYEEARERGSLEKVVADLASGCKTSDVEDLVREIERLLSVKPFPTEALGTAAGIVFRDAAEAHEWLSEFLSLLKPYIDNPGVELWPQIAR